MPIEKEHRYNPDHIDSMCGSCFALRRRWAHVAGQVVAWETAIGILNQVSAQHFIADRMSEAEQLKQMAWAFAKKLEPLKKELNGFIEER